MDFNQLIFKYGVYYPVVFIRHQNVPSYLKKFLLSQYMPVDQLDAQHAMRLKELVHYAKEYVPHYQEKLIGISERDIKTVADIKKLPFLTKGMIKERAPLLKTIQPMKFLAKKTSGGSTGEPVTVLKTADAMARELASTWRGYSWAGIDIGDRQARFWGVPYSRKDKLRARLIDFVANRKRCSAFAFNEEYLQKYTRKLERFNPRYFYGYVSMIASYAEYIKNKRIKPGYKLKSIITTAEVLTPQYREIIGEVFDARVYNEYGCGELGSIAHECEHGAMHIMAENMIVELLDGERICGCGEVGEVVVTELNNRAMPLIRYRTGDFAKLAQSGCQCGRTLPIIKEIYGREWDTIRNRYGKLYHGAFFIYIIEDAKKKNLGVKGFQVIQKDYDHLIFKVVPSHEYSKVTEDFIIERLKKDFDADAIIEIVRVNEIERAPSGKMRLTIGMGMQD